MKIYNYFCYFNSSLIPLHFLFALYFIIIKDYKNIVFASILLSLSIMFLCLLINIKPNNIFICSYKEINECSINFKNLIFLFIYFCLLYIIDFNFLIFLLMIVAFELLIYKLNFRFTSFILIFLGYKVYKIRNKQVYSKKTKEELIYFVKKNKYIQIIEISDDIFIEKDTYNIKNKYCL